MFTYLKNDTYNTLITFKNELPSDLYSTGETYDDYINDKWIKLTEEQIKFYSENSNASPKEIINMELEPINIETVRQDKLNEITEYDKSNDVNSFNLNGIDVWVDRETRVSLMSTTKIKKELGIEETTIWFGDLHVTLPCESVIQMLSTLEIYAYNCFNKTAEHKSIINAMDNVEDIKNYNFKIGYPEKLSFNI